MSRCACVLPGAGTVEPGRDQAAWRLSAVMMQCASRYVGVGSAGCGGTSGEGCSIGEVYRRARRACRDLSGHGGITMGMGIGAAPWRAKFGGGGGGGRERFFYQVPYYTLTLYTPQARNTKSFARIGALCGLLGEEMALPDWPSSPVRCGERNRGSRELASFCGDLISHLNQLHGWHSTVTVRHPTASLDTESRNFMSVSKA